MCSIRFDAVVAKYFGIKKMAIAKKKKPIPVFTSRQIDIANDAAVLLYNGRNFVTGKRIVGDRDFLVHFSSEFERLRKSKKPALRLSRNIIRDLIAVSMLKPMYRKQNELTYPGLERYFNSHYPSLYKGYKSKRDKEIKLLMSSEFVIKSAKAVVKPNVSAKAGYRVPFASRLLFFATPQMLIFNYANRLAEKQMNYQSRPHYAYPYYAKDMLEGLRNNWKELSRYNIPLKRKNKPEADISIAYKSHWWARRVFDIALLLHFRVFTKHYSVYNFNDITYKFQSKSNSVCP
jgi:hypothetical protein